MLKMPTSRMDTALVQKILGMAMQPSTPPAPVGSQDEVLIAMQQGGSAIEAIETMTLLETLASDRQDI